VKQEDYDRASIDLDVATLAALKKGYFETHDPIPLLRAAVDGSVGFFFRAKLADFAAAYMDDHSAFQVLALLEEQDRTLPDRDKAVVDGHDVGVLAMGRPGYEDARKSAFDTEVDRLLLTNDEEDTRIQAEVTAARLATDAALALAVIAAISRSGVAAMLSQDSKGRPPVVQTGRSTDGPLPTLRTGRLSFGAGITSGCGSAEDSVPSQAGIAVATVTPLRRKVNVGDRSGKDQVESVAEDVSLPPFMR